MFKIIYFWHIFYATIGLTQSQVLSTGSPRFKWSFAAFTAVLALSYFTVTLNHIVEESGIFDSHILLTFCEGTRNFSISSGVLNDHIRCFFLRLTNLLKQPDRLHFITSRLHKLLRCYGNSLQPLGFMLIKLKIGG
jgi:hypothetical protein